MNQDAIQKAWQKAQDAWEAAGKTIPCYEPNYMAAREELAKEYERAGVADRYAKKQLLSSSPKGGSHET